MRTMHADRRRHTLLSLGTILGTAALVATAAPAGVETIASSATPAGQWTLQVDWPGGRADVVLAVSEEDGALMATWTGPQGQLTPEDVTFSDAVLRFVMKVQDQNGRPVELRFEGRVAGGKIEGHLLTPRGARIAVTGTRKN